MKLISKYSNNIYFILVAMFAKCIQTILKPDDERKNQIIQNRKIDLMNRQ